MRDSPDVVVVGSANLDIVVRVPHHPIPGETVIGSNYQQIAGGKGANQAIAAARLGSQVSMVGRIGSDAPGVILRNSLEEAGVDCKYLATEEEEPSGMALIGTDPKGENTIIVSPGANTNVGPEDVVAAKPILRDANVVLLQLEVAVHAVEAAIASSNGTVILNPAPAPAPANPIPYGILERVDVLIPNQIELAQLTGVAEARSLADVERMARRLPVSVVVATLGASGALLVVEDEALLIPAPEVEVVDTTAAGDAFCGAMADALAHSATIKEAAERGVHAGALATTKLGAQPSLPTGREVDSSVGNT